MMDQWVGEVVWPLMLTFTTPLLISSKALFIKRPVHVQPTICACPTNSLFDKMPEFGCYAYHNYSIMKLGWVGYGEG